MIIPCFAFNSIDEYQARTDNFKFEKPSQCKICGAIGCFWGHGSFQRTVLQEGAEIQVSIRRFLCHNCGKTVSLLFSFLVAYRKHSAATISAAVEIYSKEETTYRQISCDLAELDSKDSPQSPAHSSIFQWVRLMANKATPLAIQAQKELLLRGRINELEELAGSTCPNAFKSKFKEKQSNLNALSEFIGLGSLLVAGSSGIAVRLHTFFLRNVETIQMMLCGHSIRLSAPQSLKH